MRMLQTLPPEIQQYIYMIYFKYVLQQITTRTRSIWFNPSYRLRRLVLIDSGSLQHPYHDFQKYQVPNPIEDLMCANCQCYGFPCTNCYLYELEGRISLGIFPPIR